MTKKAKKRLVVPADLAKLLARHETAQEAFEQLSYSHKKEYLEWITQAKKEDIRQRRMEKALDMLGEKKSRHWKYER